jgi:hypothetical protein
MAKIEAWHRRRAFMLASQLPDSTADALLVLEATKELVETFLAEPEPEKKPAPVIKLREV